MKIKKNYDLTKLNTLGVSAVAKEFIEIENEEDIQELFHLKEFKENKKMFLGGGSNILFTTDYDGIVVLNKLTGIEIIDETSNEVVVRSMSGVVWHDLVLFVVQKGYWGLENLSLIPGTVGGAPVQNIGAYGAELKNVLDTVETLDATDGSKKVFTKAECEFGYRDSVFKNKFKGKYFISAVTFKLSKIPKPNISYKILSDYLKEHTIEANDLKNISDAVSAIRRSKLPDPKVIGNAGSFFKNIFLSKEIFSEFKKKYPDIRYFEEGETVKIPAAWLIENCGPAEGGASWKGYRIGNVGVHEKHALVLVNYGGGTGKELRDLAESIIESVLLKFDLTLTPEVNLI